MLQRPKKIETMELEFGKFYVYTRSEYLLQYSQLKGAVLERRRHSSQNSTPPGVLIPSNFLLHERTIEKTTRDILIYWEECIGNGCRIQPVRFGECVLFLESHIMDNKWEFVKILSSESTGWIIFGDWIPKDAFRPFAQKSNLNLNKNLSPERFKIG